MNTNECLTCFCFLIIWSKTMYFLTVASIFLLAAAIPCCNSRSYILIPSRLFRPYETMGLLGSRRYETTDQEEEKRNEQEFRIHEMGPHINYYMLKLLLSLPKGTKSAKHQPQDIIPMRERMRFWGWANQLSGKNHYIVTFTMDCI